MVDLPQTKPDDNPDAETEARDSGEVTADIEAIEKWMLQQKKHSLRISEAEWDRVFKDMQSLLLQLAQNPFVDGDQEALQRLDRVLASRDLEDMNSRIDYFADYIAAKLSYNAQLRETETADTADGELDEQASVPPPPVRFQSGIAARAPVSPVSGSDFEVGEGDTPGDKSSDERPTGKKRRNVLRL